MTIYEQIRAEAQAYKVIRDMAAQPLDYAVKRVDTQRPGRAVRRVSIRIEMPRQSMQPDAVLHAVDAVRQSKDRGS